MSLRVCGRFHGRQVLRLLREGWDAGKAARSGGDGPADADVGSRGEDGTARPAGREAQAGLVLRSRCQLRSTWTRRRATAASALSRFAVISGEGRLAVAAPVRVEVMTARQAAVKEISRGCTGCPARRPLPAGMAIAAAARASARVGSTAVTQAACSWATRAGDPDRSIGPVDGPAPLMADLASFSEVSEPIHRQW